MNQLFTSGHIVDLICVLIVIEGLAFVAYRFKTGRRVALSSLIANLFSGLFLLLALRAALVGSSWEIIAAWLLAGLIAHINDLRLRLRQKQLN